MLPEERLSTAASRSRVRAAARAAEGRLGRPAHARQASGRCDLKCHSVASVSEVFAQRAVHPARKC
jgi:hypothetical protein